MVKRTDWRLKIKGGEEFSASPIKGEDIFQGVAIAQEVNLKNEASNC
jgi:hypothetical protein